MDYKDSENIFTQFGLDFCKDCCFYDITIHLCTWMDSRPILYHKWILPESLNKNNVCLYDKCSKNITVKENFNYNK